MPNVITLLEDEIHQIRGTLATNDSLSYVLSDT
jgi:hypothetical protein